jgi:hypothetical protein
MVFPSRRARLRAAFSAFWISRWRLTIDVRDRRAIGTPCDEAASRIEEVALGGWLR